MRISLKQSELGLRNSSTRIPFRYGSACMTSCPQAVLRVTIEADGKLQHGYSGDCLPPSWFDKSPEKNYQQQVEEMLSAISVAVDTFHEELGKPSEFFPAWIAAYETVHRVASQRHWEPLLASFGLSMPERAILDAMARAVGISFANAIRENLYGLVPAEIHHELSGLQVADWLPEKPVESIHVRHTIGLADPLTMADIPMDERLNDGFPQSLEEYIVRTGIRYFKIKVSKDRNESLDRLAIIGELLNRHCGDNYQITIDGNEQFTQPKEVLELLHTMQSNPDSEKLLAATIAIEQPLERRIALDPAYADSILELCRIKPVIIDESDSTIDAYSRALELGYRGVSSKNCKGPIKSLMNAGLTWLRNARGDRNDYLITGEDLTCVGVVPLQSDLCLVATLGLTHLERNGHHYHRGLSYLPISVQQAVMSAHGDLYHSCQGIVAPRLNAGKFDIGSLQCAGFGFAVEPDLESMQSPEDWQFSSLGLQTGDSILGRGAS